MKTKHQLIQGLALLAFLSTLCCQPLTACAQGVYTNWNSLVTNWVQTSAPLTNWSSIASSADGTMLAAASYGGIYTSTNDGVTWIQTSALTTDPLDGKTAPWRFIVSSADGMVLAACFIDSDNDYSAISISTNAGVVWGPLTGVDDCGSIASSANGAMLATVQPESWIWTTTNAYANLPEWTKTSAPVEDWTYIAASADGAMLAAVVYGGGIYTSTNAGVTWTQTSAPNEGEGWESIALSADGTKLAAVAVGGGIYTSTNAGATWTQTSAPSEGWISIASSSDGTKLAAVDYYPGGIYTSINGGVSWTQTSAPSEDWESIASSADGTMLAAVVDGGGIWTAQATIQTPPPTLTNIVVTPANPVIAANSNVIFTATGQFNDGSQTNLTSTNGLVWSSSDPSVASIDTNGLATGLSAGVTTISAAYSNFTNDTVLTAIAPPTISINPVSATVSPSGSATLNVSASGSDLSYQWAFNGTDIIGATNTTLVITNISLASVGSYTVAVSNPVGSITSTAANVASLNIGLFQGQGVSYTNWNDLVTNWFQTSAPSGNWVSIASSSDGTKLAAVVNGNGIYTSTNAGVTWTQTSAPDGDWYFIASSVDGTKLAAVAQLGGGIWTSTNAGLTWTQTSAPGESWTSIASSSDGTQLAAVDFGGGIYTSTNAGAAWVQTSAPDDENWHSIASSSDGTKLAAVADGEGIYNGAGIYTSTNAGATWMQTSAPSEGWYSIVSSSDGTELAAVNNYGGGIYTSTNAGATWTQTSAPNEDWDSIASSANGTKLAAVNGNEIYISTNAGVTWIQTGAPNEDWGSIASSADGTMLVAAADFGGGIDIAQTTIQTTASWTNVAASVNAQTFAGVVVDGPLGSNYLIQTTSNLMGNWTTLTNVALPTQPYIYIDYNSPANSRQFYRAVTQ